MSTATETAIAQKVTNVSALPWPEQNEVTVLLEKVHIRLTPTAAYYYNSKGEATLFAIRISPNYIVFVLNEAKIEKQRRNAEELENEKTFCWKTHFLYTAKQELDIFRTVRQPGQSIEEQTRKTLRRYVKHLVEWNHWTKLQNLWNTEGYHTIHLQNLITGQMRLAATQLTEIPSTEPRFKIRHNPIHPYEFKSFCNLAQSVGVELPPNLIVHLV